MASLRIENLRKAYGDTPIVHDISCSFDDGEFIVIVGPSGCGKSTLLRMIAGLEPASSGQIYIDGRDVTSTSAAQRGVAMVFQSYALYPHMTVRENMSFGLKNLKRSKEDIKSRVDAAAQLLRLNDHLDRLPSQLSGGQRQRVAIGRAIVREPKIFLFDEPLSNLDAELRVQMRLEIARLHREMASATMIYVTHDQVEAMTLADKIVLLHAGALIEERGSVAQLGTPMALYHRPASRFVAEFIGSPKMNFLPGRLMWAQEHGACVEVAGLQVLAAVDARHLNAGDAVHVGIRPEHAVLADPSADALLAGTITHSERLGDSSVLYVGLGQGLPTFNLRVDGSVHARHGETLSLRLPTDALHVFDASGQACRRTVELPT